MKENTKLTLKTDLYPQLFLLLCSLMTYILGAGQVHYLYGALNARLFWFGLFWLVLFQMAVVTLHFYFKWNEPEGAPLMAENQAQRRRVAALMLGVAATLLTVTAILTFSLMQAGQLRGAAGFVLMLALLLSLSLVLPPVRLEVRGFGELTVAFLVCNLVPLWSFLLQTGDFNSFMAFDTFPLTTLFMTMALALEFEGYNGDPGAKNANLLAKLGWEWGVKLHAVFILLTYLLLGAAYFLGLAWRITWPVLLTVLIALLQLYLIDRMVSGEKPAWRLLKISASGNFILAVYLFAFSFWRI